MESTNKSIKIMGSWELDKMRVACRAAAELLDYLGKMIVPGISTDNINESAARWVYERGYTNAPLGYLGGGTIPFSKSICTSRNDIICHGIPSVEEILRDGDIINVDVTPIVAGYHGDCSQTFAVGKISDEAAKLIKITNECLDLGIAAVKPGARIGDIGAAIFEHASMSGFSVVRAFTGHGIGTVFHTLPIIPHFGIKFTGARLEPGMVFTIEPMLNAGDWRAGEISPNGWTVKTKDGSLSAQAEHTVAVTNDGVEILTRL